MIKDGVYTPENVNKDDAWDDCQTVSAMTASDMIEALKHAKPDALVVLLDGEGSRVAIAGVVKQVVNGCPCVTLITHDHLG